MLVDIECTDTFIRWGNIVILILFMKLALFQVILLNLQNLTRTIDISVKLLFIDFTQNIHLTK